MMPVLYATECLRDSQSSHTGWVNEEKMLNKRMANI